VDSDGDYVDAVLLWASAAITSSERLLRVDQNFTPWASKRPRPESVFHKADAALMLLALRNVLRACRWAADELRSLATDVDEILTTFDSYLPGVVNARDALEHFDEYAVGRGRLQRTDPTPYGFSLILIEGRLTIQVGPIALDVEDARSACRWLVVAMLARVPVTDPKRATALLEQILAEGAAPDQVE